MHAFLKQSNKHIHRFGHKYTYILIIENCNYAIIEWEVRAFGKINIDTYKDHIYIHIYIFIYFSCKRPEAPLHIIIEEMHVPIDKQAYK